MCRNKIVARVSVIFMYLLAVEVKVPPLLLLLTPNLSLPVEQQQNPGTMCFMLVRVK